MWINNIGCTTFVPSDPDTIIKIQKLTAKVAHYGTAG